MIFNSVFLIKSCLNKLGYSTEKGQGLVEYAIIIMMIAIAVIVGLTLFGEELLIMYERISNNIPSP